MAALGIAPSRSFLERGQLALLALLALLTAGAWALTVHQARTMNMPMGVVARAAADPAPDEPTGDASGMADMAGMEGVAMPVAETPSAGGASSVAATGMAGMAGDGWTWDGFTAFLVAWAVMMAAMMFPAAAPMLLLFRSMAKRRTTGGSALGRTAIFAGGYLLVWTAVGVVAWLVVQLGSDLAERLGNADRRTWAPLALGAVLIVAGLYQLTPLKGACLRHCQSPVGFVMTHWRDGWPGALRMGLVHGAVCLGCCWALFAVLVAAGVMSLAWMLLLTLVVFAEKVLPLGRRAPWAVGAAFLVLGLIVATGALDLPWRA